MSLSLSNNNTHINNDKYHSNILYQIKKQSLSKATLYQPSTQDDDIRKQLFQLRTKNRSLQTQISRLKSTIDQLNQKIIIFQNTQKLDNHYQNNNMQNYQGNSQLLNNTNNSKQLQRSSIAALSKIPMLLENNELRQSNQILHKENLTLNGKNNHLQAKNRQITSQYQKLKRKLKQLQIIQKMRQQRFRDELQRMTPIVVNQPNQFVAMKEGVLKMTDYMRERIVDTVFYIFQTSAKQCQTNKKVNSFTIFLNYWIDLKKNKNLGFASIVSCYKSMKKLVKMIKQDYLQQNTGEQILQNPPYRDTMNQWLLNSIIQIKNTPQGKDPQSKLFRSLGLKYRSRFPIKGQHYQIDQDVQRRLQDFICIQVQKLLFK